MSRNMVVAGAVAAAVFVGVYFAARQPTPAASTSGPPAAAAPVAPPPAAVPPAPTQGTMLRHADASARPTPVDPRIAAVMGPAARDALVEYIAGPDGRVIQEIDQDPNSRGYRRPLREYLYAGERIVGVTNYRYLGDQVQIVRTMVAYKPDGSVDEVRDTTAYEADARSR